MVVRIPYEDTYQMMIRSVIRVPLDTTWLCFQAALLEGRGMMEGSSGRQTPINRAMVPCNAVKTKTKRWEGGLRIGAAAAQSGRSTVTTAAVGSPGGGARRRSR